MVSTENLQTQRWTVESARPQPCPGDVMFNLITEELRVDRREERQPCLSRGFHSGVDDIHTVQVISNYIRSWKEIG